MYFTVSLLATILLYDIKRIKKCGIFTHAYNQTEKARELYESLQLARVTWRDLVLKQ